MQIVAVVAAMIVLLFSLEVKADENHKTLDSKEKNSKALLQVKKWPNVQQCLNI